MINKLAFFGCSITGGNELFEEAHISNYKTLSFDQARKVAKNFPDDDIESYNRAHSFPSLTALELGTEFENFGIPGISNKEIACRALANFPDEKYTGVVAILQLTTHNRMFLRYKETETDSTLGSFVVHPKLDDDRLSKRQNNLLKEMFFEFFNESMMSIDDHIFMYYAADILRSKGIPTYILWCSVDVIDWANFEIANGVDKDKTISLKNDKAPAFLDSLSHHIAGSHHKFNLLGKTLAEIIPPDSALPRFHYNQLAHKIIAKKLAEKLKCLTG
jgi:hypothetical protein